MNNLKQFEKTIENEVLPILKEQKNDKLLYELITKTHMVNSEYMKLKIEDNRIYWQLNKVLKNVYVP